MALALGFERVAAADASPTDPPPEDAHPQARSLLADPRDVLPEARSVLICLVIALVLGLIAVFGFGVSMQDITNGYIYSRRW